MRSAINMACDSTKKLIFREGLGQILLRADKAAARPIEQPSLLDSMITGVCLNTFVVLDQRTSLITVQTRHHDVDKYDVRMMVRDLRQCIETVRQQ